MNGRNNRSMRDDDTDDALSTDGQTAAAEEECARGGGSRTAAVEEEGGERDCPRLFSFRISHATIRRKNDPLSGLSFAQVCTWFQEISSCSCLTVLPGPAWVLLSKTCKPLFAPL